MCDGYSSLWTRKHISGFREEYVSVFRYVPWLEEDWLGNDTENKKAKEGCKGLHSCPVFPDHLKFVFQQKQAGVSFHNLWFASFGFHNLYLEYLLLVPFPCPDPVTYEDN